MFEIKMKTKNNVEELSNKLFDNGALSVSTTEKNNEIEISALFNEINFTEFENIDYKIKEIEDSDWKYNWLDNYSGSKISNEIYIYPHKYKDPKPTNYKYVIELDPKDAFGNGNHPTTAMCLKELNLEISHYENKNLKQISLLDAGTGTGILAILAAKMGISMIDAFDIDQESIDKTLENCKYNDVESIYVMKSDISNFPEIDKYNIITANLLTDIIIKNVDKLVALLADNGTLIISGIGITWHDEVVELFRTKKLKIEKHIIEDNWSCYILKHCN